MMLWFFFPFAVSIKKKSQAGWLVIECRSKNVFLAPEWLALLMGLSSDDITEVVLHKGGEEITWWDGRLERFRTQDPSFNMTPNWGNWLNPSLKGPLLLSSNRLGNRTSMLGSTFILYINTYYTIVPFSNIPCRTTASFPNPSTSYFTQASRLSASLVLLRQSILGQYSTTLVFLIILVEEY